MPEPSTGIFITTTPSRFSKIRISQTGTPSSAISITWCGLSCTPRFCSIARCMERTRPGYHLLNLLLHLGSGLLIYCIIARAVADERSVVPFWTSLLFLIHPIATETVTYISGRASGLMTFFYLLAFFLYIKASEEFRTALPRRFYLSGAVASFSCWRSAPRKRRSRFRSFCSFGMRSYAG